MVYKEINTEVIDKMIIKTGSDLKYESKYLPKLTPRKIIIPI